MLESANELTLVMPVYNEQDAIVGVVREWMEELIRLGLRFEFHAYNDGSRDATEERLQALAREYPQLCVTNKPNEGHGPTILRGYREAATPWVFQTDSDGEMPAAHFSRLWQRREGYDALIGTRTGRAQALPRRLISFFSRCAVRVFFGKGVADVNAPYRLMRSSCLRPIVAALPDDTFAPNVIISGVLARAKARIWNEPVPHQGRKTGTVSLVKWRLWKSAFKALWQTLRCSLTLRPIVPRTDSPVAGDRLP
jgi:dolichol-phosphate mannosyltransferase